MAQVKIPRSLWGFWKLHNSKAFQGRKEPQGKMSVNTNFWSLLPCCYIHRSSQVRVLQAQVDKRTGSIRTIASSEACQHAQNENRKIIAELLGIEEEEVTTTKIPSKLISKEKALHTMDVLKTFGFSSSSIHLYPELLLMSGGAVENYIRIMQETGFPSVREVFIVRFRTVYKQSLSVLQRKVSIPKVDVIVQRYCAELQEGDAFYKEIVTRLPHDTDKMTLLDLRNSLMGRYIGKLLMGSLDESLTSFAKYPRMYYRCFNWVKRNYEILKEFGFSTEKIRSHFYLLHGDPSNLSRILTIKSLGGLDMTKIGHLRPKILMSTYDTLMDIEKSLISHGIPFDAIQKYPEVYTLSAATIRQRLNEMDTIPEFQLLKTHPRVARLLYYQNKAKSRLEEFRTMQIRVPSLHVLSSDTKRYNRSLSSGDFRAKGVDITIYLSEILQVKKQRIRESLVRHPHWLHIPIVNIEYVLKFIQSVHAFKTDQLVDAIPLLLYPKEKVEKAFENVLTSGESDLSDDYFLQMVLYNLERPVHFTGDAVWPEKVAQHEYEDDDAIIMHKSSEGSK